LQYRRNPLSLRHISIVYFFIKSPVNKLRKKKLPEAYAAALYRANGMLKPG